MRISDWSSDVCSSDLFGFRAVAHDVGAGAVLVAVRLAGHRGRPAEMEILLARIAHRPQAVRPLAVGAFPRPHPTRRPPAGPRPHPLRPPRRLQPRPLYVRPRPPTPLQGRTT